MRALGEAILLFVRDQGGNLELEVTGSSPRR
jgi:hypothetical protein